MSSNEFKLAYRKTMNSLKKETGKMIFQIFLKIHQMKILLIMAIIQKLHKIKSVN